MRLSVNRKQDNSGGAVRQVERPRLSVDIKKSYPGFTLDMRFVLTGSRVGILGASGCGKSMTLRAIAGIHTPDEGRILLGGRVLYDSARRIDLKPQVRNVGYLFQNYALFPNMTVRGNIMAGIRGRIAERMALADEMIEKFSLKGLEDRFPGELSGGQQQRTALARIMAHRPDVILLDEPFSALDWYLRDRMQLELTEMLRDYDGMVIMVSHDRDEIYRFSDELLIADRGKVIRQGKTKDVFADPGTREAAVLTGCKNFSRATRLDDHHVKAEDWGITVETEKVLPPQISHLGFRAHQFRPVYGAAPHANVIRCDIVSSAELQFERNYYIRPQTDDAGDHLITWLVQREFWPLLDEKGMPDHLLMPEEDFLFLR